MIKAIAIDDEPLALEILKEYCGQVDFISLEKTFTQTTEAKRHLENFPVDLLFLDIHMPAISGIDFYKGLDQDTMVVFTTAHSQYAIEGFNLSAIDYLLKPFSFERFKQAALKANDFFHFLHSATTETKGQIFVRSDYSLLKVETANILYIEGLADYLRIFTTTGKPIITRMTMKDMLEQLPNDFMRVHRSFIIPLSRVEGVRNKKITLSGTQIPIGATYRSAFQKAYGS
ncbi:MAG: response regulator transcription factor [Cyclobacteriaceae bacterium]|nr:response regulator transcription factor [Cyclobacteriaceae bacterium]